MDRRTVLALVLVALVILLTPKLFPPAPRVLPTADSSGVVDSVGVADSLRQPSDNLPPAIGGAPIAVAQQDSTIIRIPAETLHVADTNAAFTFLNVGAALQEVELRQYRALNGSDGVVRLEGRGAPLISFTGIVGRDTIDFASTNFRVIDRGITGPGGDGSGQSRNLSMEGVVGDDTLTLDYRIQPDSFLVRVDARVRGPLAQNGYILMNFAPTLASYEADSVDDYRNLSFVYEVAQRGSKGTAFGKLDPGERLVVPGPLTWVALKSKYFIVGALARDSVSPIAEFTMTGLARTSRIATHAQGTAVIQPRQGGFSLDIYAGPQQAQRLAALGRDFENSNPYGGFLQPIVQPFAGLVMTVLLWMRHTFNIGYGWVLVIFGVAVRILLWPLNQKAMKTSMKMQRIQPELQALQTKYKNDPQKLQTEMMRVYKDHDMSPFSMFSGCLPLLLPMPILFALFFVFRSTIEFRGVPFLWMADISLKDPFYILPLVMGVSMFVLSWIGSRNTPPNPQTKMMMYLFPVMMTFLLANLAAGLNLYYAVQNVAALPQQWLIANERAKTAAKTKK
jgi:YidC/Oxa1 family membrane protein insertase